MAHPTPAHQIADGIYRQRYTDSDQLSSEVVIEMIEDAIEYDRLNQRIDPAYLTPEQLTDKILEDESLGTWRERITAAIKAEAAQHNLIDEVARVLDDREAHAAAQLVRDTDPDDDLWSNYIGPMLDSLEDDYTKLAGEINQ